MIVYNQNLHTFYSTLLNKDEITSGFGTKINGDGRKNETIEKILENANAKYNGIVTPHQTHSLDIKVIRRVTLHEPVNCDGVITQEKGIVLTIVTADCSPIIYWDSQSNIIGISHQGWKGTVAKLPSHMVEKMIKLGANRDHIRCAIGPTINDCCYEIFGDRKEKFKKEFGSEIFQQKDNRTTLNLIKANHMTLVKAGIKAENIDFSPFCTSCNQEKFYSYHRDKGIQGEMISFIVQ